MTVVSNRNIIISAPDGTERYFLPRGYIGAIPEWVEKTAYFHALVADGKISVSGTTKDKDLETADEEAKEAEARARNKSKKKALEEQEEQEKLENTEAAQE